MGWYGLGSNAYGQISSPSGALAHYDLFQRLSNTFDRCVGISFSQIAWRLANNNGVEICGFEQALPTVEKDDDIQKFVGKDEFRFCMTDTGCIYNLRTLQVVDVGGSAIDIAMDGTERLAVLLSSGVIHIFDGSFDRIPTVSSPQLAPNEKPRSLHTLSSSFYAITTLSRLIPVLTDSRFPDASQILEGEQIRRFAAGGGWDWIALDELTTVWDSKSKGEPVEFPYESDLQVKDVACGNDWVIILTWEGKVFKRDKDAEWKNVRIPNGIVEEVCGREGTLLLRIKEEEGS